MRSHHILGQLPKTVALNRKEGREWCLGRRGTTKHGKGGYGLYSVVLTLLQLLNVIDQHSPHDRYPVTIPAVMQYRLSKDLGRI